MPPLATPPAQVLTNVSGVFRHSRMIAIMGPSGCGKTTLMNTLCGRAQYGTRRGAVLINGNPLHLPTLKTVMGFVPQDDTVFGDLTVRENISYRCDNILWVSARARVGLAPGLRLAPTWVRANPNPGLSRSLV